MRTFRPLPIVFMIGILLLSACGGKPVPPAPTASPQPAGALSVTLDDQGKTISMAVGDQFLLNLGETYNWDVSISDQTVVSRVIGITVIRGAQGVYQANQAGTVTLSATGDPQCLQSQPPCAMPSMQFSVTIVVK